METLYKYTILLFLLKVDAKTEIIFTDQPLQMIGNRVYKKELLTDKFQGPKELAYDSASRNLFFMYMDDDIQNSGRATINVVTKQAKKIAGIEKNKATAVDSGIGEVYFGSEDGVYKYDPIENVARNIGLYNINIMKLVVRNNEMFLIDANTHMIYKVFDDFKIVVRVANAQTVMEFDVDNQRNIHFVSRCGLFCITKDHEVVKNADLNLAYHFIVDGNRTLGVTENGIYELQCSNGTATKISDINFFPKSIIFGDYGDIYYTIDDNIFKLKPVRSYLIYNIYKKRKDDNNDVLGSK